MLINYDDHDHDHDHDDDCASANVWHPSADNVGNLRLIPAHPTITAGKPLKAGHQTIQETAHCTLHKAPCTHRTLSCTHSILNGTHCSLNGTDNTYLMEHTAHYILKNKQQAVQTRSSALLTIAQRTSTIAHLTNARRTRTFDNCTKNI